MGKTKRKRRGWLVLFTLRCPVPSERGPLFPEGSQGPPDLLLGWLCSVTTLSHGAWVRTRTQVCDCTPVISFCVYRASLVAQTVKNPPAEPATWVPSLGWEDPPGGEHNNPLHYSCLENLCGQRSLAGCSPWGDKESDMTEQLSTHIQVQVKDLSQAS